MLPGHLWSVKDLLQGLQNINGKEENLLTNTLFILSSFFSIVFKRPLLVKEGHDIL